MTEHADEKSRARLRALLAIHADEQLTAEEHTELTSLLRGSAALREEYFRFTTLQALLHIEARRKTDGGPHLLPVSTPTRNISEGSASRAPHSPFRNPHSGFPQLLRSAAGVLLHPMALVLVMSILAAGVIAYKFSTAPVAAPVVEHAPAVAPVARLVNSTDAKWPGTLDPLNKQLTSGQHLVLERGSAEILFNNQARVILEGPTEFVVVDAGTCRLSTGKLTAQVPDPAKGFKVHTPDGTVTDLGTEFGVYVKTGPEIPKSDEPLEQTEPTGPQPDGTRPPITEVHVFKGKVDVTRSGVGSGKADAVAQNPTSDLRPPISTILSTGEAVTISENKVQPLPAADPFQFALDKLNGSPRQVLLKEDFETYELGKAGKAIGPWLVQGGSFRRGQGVYVIDPAETIAYLLAQPNISIPHASPSPAVGQRVAKCISSIEFPKDTYPLLAREIDCREFARGCQVLVEFDLFAQTDPAEPSLAFAAEVGQAPGIALWQNSDATAQKIPWLAARWYRVRVLLDVIDGSLGEVRVERSNWAGADGWVRDSSYTPPVPKIEWKVPPRYVVFGFPVPPTAQSGGHYWLDNLRIEVIARE